jgi:hypothetical protein
MARVSQNDPRLFATTAFMTGDPETPRLQLGDLFPDDGKDGDRPGIPLMSARKTATPDRPNCSHCAGELVRSRIRVYERFLTYFTKTRPYRCLDCRARRWR